MDKHDKDHEDGGIDELDHVPQPGGRLTGATIATVRDRLLQDGLLFRLDREGIARHFCDPFYGGKTWRVSLAELRDVIANLDGCPDDIPADPQDFPKWVQEELLEFKYLPMDKLAELYSWASEDLLTIEANIANCTQAVEDVKTRSPKTDADESDIRFFNYYLRLNESAREEIVDVLTHRMRNEAMRAAYGPVFLFDIHVPWSFRWNPDGFNYAAFSPVRHAFLEFSIRELHEIQDLHNKADDANFERRLKTYIFEKNPVGRIRELLGTHHLLAMRKDILEPALQAFERAEFALFSSTVAIQIEGLIEDACHLSAVSLEELRGATLIPKLDALVRESPVRIDYVYYAFRFPVLRNRVAHGRLLQGDLRRIAELLLLDLYDCCKIVCRHPGPANALIALLTKLKQHDATLADVVEFAAIYAETNGERPSAFYKLDETFFELLLLLDKSKVWDFIELLISVEYDDLDIGVRFLANRLKKLRPALQRPCAQLLLRLGSRGDGEFDRIEFMSVVRRQQFHDIRVVDVDGCRSSLLGLLRARERWLRIATLAHRRWQDRGCVHGADWNDWFEAERRVVGAGEG